MKQWFPFTDYDFYAYLAAGMFLLLGLDLSISGGAFMLREEWPIVQIVMVIAAAYVVGQLAAGSAAALLEHGLARRVLRSPCSLMLGLQEPRWIEKAIAALFIGRNYSPLPPSIRRQLLDKATTALKVEIVSDAEEVFALAYPVARSTPDTAARIDQFRNLYGFCRNVSFVALVSAACLGIRAITQPLPYGKWLAAISLIVAIGMFARFLKFYADFAAEVLRAYQAKA